MVDFFRYPQHMQRLSMQPQADPALSGYSAVFAWLAGAEGDTFLAAIVVALLSGSIGALGYFGKVILTAILARREDRKLFRNATALFKNDVVIRGHDFKNSHSDDAFDIMVQQIIDGPDDFKFSVPSSDDSESEEMMKFIHRMHPNQARLIRTYILYSKLQGSTAVVLSSSLAEFDKPRKLRALASYRETSQLVDYLGIKVLKDLNRDWWEPHPDHVFDHILAEMTALDTGRKAFVDIKMRLLQQAPKSSLPVQSNGGSGPDTIDLQDFIKAAHKIANAYRSFNSSN
jgi:hypothetical protein